MLNVIHLHILLNFIFKRCCLILFDHLSIQQGSTFIFLPTTSDYNIYLSEHKSCLSKKFQFRRIKSCFFSSCLCYLFLLLYVPIIFAPYFVRSMTLSITQMESRMIIMYFDAYDKIVDNKKVLWILVLYIHIYWNNFSHNVTKNYFSSRQVLAIFTCHNYFLHC